MNSAWLFCVGMVVVIVVPTSDGSAIPMWEYLSRSEKMAHLYQMFGKQVQGYCDNQSTPDCHKVLLVYGMTNLAKMSDDHLDTMDPYQRGAQDIIWDSMMKGGVKPTTTGEEDTYSTGGDSQVPGNGLGSEEAASSVEEYVSGGPSRFLVGPMVMRVMPDGRPVPGDAQRPLPADEDAEEYMQMRSKPAPSVAELEKHLTQARPAPSVAQMEKHVAQVRPAYSRPAQFRIHSV